MKFRIRNVFFLSSKTGKYEYKFCVDGKWFHDPTVASIANEFGSRNNVIDVRPCEYDLDYDGGPEQSKTGEYGQVVPARHSYDKAGAPPWVPPHLKDFALNHNVAAEIEPNLLPKPMHVELNHMYALSIKDGVMVREFEMKIEIMNKCGTVRRMGASAQVL